MNISAVARNCKGIYMFYSLHVPTQGKTSCKIFDTVQKRGHFPCKILKSLKFLTRFLQLAKTRNVKVLA